MFNNTKYTHWYYSIISNAQQRSTTSGEYYERHHIIPRSLGGDNKRNNIVALTAREHYVCHLLLPRMCVSQKHRASMAHACLMMSQWNSTSTQGKRPTGRLYAATKRRYVELTRGDNHPLHGVRWSEDRKQKHSALMKRLGVNVGAVRTQATREKISRTRKQAGTGAGERNSMYGKHHTDAAKQQMSQIKKERLTDEKRSAMILSNPRTRAVQDHLGNVFPSVSAAGRHYGYRGAQGVRARIARGEWTYV